MKTEDNEHLIEFVDFNDNFFTNNILVIKALEHLKTIKIDISDSELQTAKEIAYIMFTEMNLQDSALASALLYLALKKTKLDISLLERQFDKEIYNTLDGLFRINNFPLKRYEKNVENFIKLVLSVTTDFKSIFIKIAEQLYMMRNLNKYELPQKENIASENQHIYSQLAHRLGLYAVKTELEEMCMKFFNYEIYKDIAHKLDATKQEREEFIVDFIKPIKVMMEQNKIVCDIKGRPKAISSIWSKMKRQNVGFEKVYDTFAIRVIIECPQEQEKFLCWQAYSLITDKYKPNSKRLRDWISAPKKNGYESLHTTVLGNGGNWVEVQIRTKRMDEIAEQGHAAHWKYKEYSNEKNETDLYSKIRNSLETPVEMETTEDNIKAELYSNEIFIFTPKGDIIKLNEKDTVLDMAFAIHTNIGAKCVGAVVNGKNVSYKEMLKNGDSVEIRTSNIQKPSREWLRIANNTRTKTKIRRIIKDLEFKWASIGKEKLQQKFKNLEIEFIDQNLRILEKFFECKNTFELFEGFGNDKLDIQKIKKAFDLEEVKDTTPAPVTKEIKETESKRRNDKYLYIDNNFDTIQYKFAKCCNPIPGDDIVAFISVAEGAKVHRRNCKNALHSIEKYPYRMVEAKWSKNIEDTFEEPVTIMITGNNHEGIANSITSVISNELKVKMRSINIEVMPKNCFKGYTSIYVKDKNQLNNIILRLQKVKDVLNVVRITK